MASLWPALFCMCHSFIHSLSCSCFCCPLCRSGPMTFKACSSSSNSTSWKSHSAAEKPGVSLLLCWFSSLIRPLCLQSGCYHSSSYILSALDPVESKVPAPDDFTHVLGLLRVPQGNNCHSTEPLLGATHTPAATCPTSLNPHGNAEGLCLHLIYRFGKRDSKLCRRWPGSSVGGQGPNGEHLSPQPVRWSPKVLPGNVLPNPERTSWISTHDLPPPPPLAPDPPLWAGSRGVLHHHLHLPKPSLLLLGTHCNSSRRWQVRVLLENPGDCKPLRGLSPHLQGPLCTSSTPFAVSESLLCAN